MSIFILKLIFFDTICVAANAALQVFYEFSGLNICGKYFTMILSGFMAAAFYEAADAV